MKTNNDFPSCVPASPDSRGGRPDEVDLPSFDDLQPMFDDMDRRLAAVLGRPEARVASLNLSVARAFRRRVALLGGLLAFALAGVAVYWGAVLWRYNYDIYVLLFSLSLELIFLILLAEVLLSMRALFRSVPSSAGGRRGLGHSSGIYGPQVALAVFGRIASVGLTVCVAFIMVSCATTIGDGHTLTQNHHGRPEAVAVVTQVINNINVPQ